MAINTDTTPITPQDLAALEGRLRWRLHLLLVLTVSTLGLGLVALAGLMRFFIIAGAWPLW